jgi:soluble lytic murein transglycosylase
VVDAGAASDDDLLAYATLVARRERAGEAARVWRDVAVRAQGAALQSWARVQEGRMLVRAGDDAAATRTLGDLVERAPGDTSAALAAWLLGDRAASDDRIDEARSRFAWIAERHAASPWAARGAFEGALLVLTDRPAMAADELDALAARWPASDEAPGALYWAGRARLSAGDSAGAATRWGRVIEGHPRSYHATLAADRLGRALPTIPEGAAIVAPPTVRDAVDRMSALEALGFMPEAALERAAIEEAAGDDPVGLLGAAAALVTSARPGVGIRLAQQAIERGAPQDATVLRLLYPWPHEALIRREAERRGVDAHLAAALIRQESRFTPDAVSGVGARGLMQLMPDVARSIARAEGRRFTVAMLDDPAVNVPIGMRHLASDLARWPHPAYALASYNAGGSRVARWRARPGGDDPELFAERIPFAETRDYVRTVLRTRALYRQLHGTGAGVSSSGR